MFIIYENKFYKTIIRGENNMKNNKGYNPSCVSRYHSFVNSCRSKY